MNLINSHLPQFIISVTTFVSGVLIFLSSNRKRKDFDVPLIAPHTKAVVGGALILCGITVAASMFIVR